MKGNICLPCQICNFVHAKVYGKNVNLNMYALGTYLLLVKRTIVIDSFKQTDYIYVYCIYEYIEY